MAGSFNRSRVKNEKILESFVHSYFFFFIFESELSVVCWGEPTSSSLFFLFSSRCDFVDGRWRHSSAESSSGVRPKEWKSTGDFSPTSTIRLAQRKVCERSEKIKYRREKKKRIAKRYRSRAEERRAEIRARIDGTTMSCESFVWTLKKSSRFAAGFAIDLSSPFWNPLSDGSKADLQPALFCVEQLLSHWLAVIENIRCAECVDFLNCLTNGVEARDDHKEAVFFARQHFEPQPMILLPFSSNLIFIRWFFRRSLFRKGGKRGRMKKKKRRRRWNTKNYYANSGKINEYSRSGSARESMLCLGRERESENGKFLCYVGRSPTTMSISCRNPSAIIKKIKEFMSNLSRSQLDGPVNDRELWNERRRRIGMDGKIIWWNGWKFMEVNHSYTKRAVNRKIKSIYCSCNTHVDMFHFNYHTNQSLNSFFFIALSQQQQQLAKTAK